MTGDRLRTGPRHISRPALALLYALVSARPGREPQPRRRAGPRARPPVRARAQPGPGRVFLDPASRRLLPDWAEVAAQTAAALRAEADPHDPRTVRLIAELETDEEFRRLWARNETRPARDELKRFAHPVLGSLALRRQALTVGGHLLDRHARAAVPRDPHDVLAELFRIGLGHSDILPTCPAGQASSDVTRSCGRPLQYGYKGAERGAGDHVVRVLVGLQEHRHDDPGDLDGAVLVEAERPADVLDDLDLGAAGVGEADRLDAALCRCRPP